MTDELDTLTDAKLSEVFAKNVAGYTADADGWFLPPPPRRIALLSHELPSFATSADAVLPYLQARYRWQATGTKSTTVVQVWTGEGPQPNATVQDITFARAACIALIRAKRAEKGGAS